MKSFDLAEQWDVSGSYQNVDYKNFLQKQPPPFCEPLWFLMFLRATFLLRTFLWQDETNWFKGKDDWSCRGNIDVEMESMLVVDWTLKINISHGSQSLRNLQGGGVDGFLKPVCLCFTPTGSRVGDESYFRGFVSLTSVDRIYTIVTQNKG